MARLSKPEVKVQEQIERLLEKDILTFDDKHFILENFNPAYFSEVTRPGAFFTPMGLARDFSFETRSAKNIIDLCAGIGGLSFQHIDLHNPADSPTITCIEYNPTFVAIGKKIVPEATWINGDVLDKQLLATLGTFDAAYSNPPFGRIKTSEDSSWLSYSGSEFELKVVEVACRLSTYSAFILPQQSAPFQYSGRSYRQEEGYHSNKLKKWIKQTGIELKPGIGIDAHIYKDQWKNVNVDVEIVCVDLDEQDEYHPKVTPENAFQIEEQMQLFA